MENYLLFKQVVCLILFFETLVIWPRFSLYFSPPVFPNSIFTTPFRIHAFNTVLLTALILLFFNIYPVVASLILFLGVRYLYMADTWNRISTFGAVGHMWVLTTLYLLFFEIAIKIGALTQLVHTLFALEIGLALFSAGIYKCFSGYLTDSGFEYALVNPSWGKFPSFFKKLKPSSWFFKVNNWTAIAAELLTGVFFFIPQTRFLGACLLAALFLYVFLTVRANILPLLMMSFTLLYLPPIPFHFPALPSSAPLAIPFISLLKALLIAFFAFNLLFTLFYLARLIKPFPVHPFLLRLWSVRPCFIWDVFCSCYTDYFVTIQKASKATKQITATLYDENSHFRYFHHHEHSIILNLFALLRGNQETKKFFLNRTVLYAKTLLPEEEWEETAIVFTIMKIDKTGDKFLYKPFVSFFIDIIN